MTTFSWRHEYISPSLLASAVVLYAFWLTHGTFQLFSWPSNQADLNLVFNSMLSHMLRGRFDVDPAVIGNEEFVRGGRVYAYWGVLPAVMRFPLLFFRDGLRLDVTCLSSFVAVVAAATMKLRTLRLIFHNAPASYSKALYWALLLALLFSGAQIEFLKPSAYQEVCLWAGALGACFVFFAIRGLVAGSFSVRSLCGMAVIAGLALLTRVSTGVGLYLSVVALLLVNPIRALVTSSPAWKRIIEFARDLSLSQSVVLPVGVLLLFALLAGAVNYERWGDPLEFADYHAYMFNHRFADRLVRMQQYGLFNLSRIPFGVIYYFFPIWVLQRANGQLLFQEHQTRLFDQWELPPSTFLLTDALLLLLLTFAYFTIAKPRKLLIDRPVAVAIAVGLSVSCFLILSASSFSFRYRIDFYPFIEFNAFLGGALLTESPLLIKKRTRLGLLVASAVSMLASHIELILYKISNYGSAVRWLRPGILHYYMEQLGPHMGRFHSLLN